MLAPSWDTLSRDEAVLNTQTLRSISTLHDLPHLVAALGHEPMWEPVAPDLLDGGRSASPPAEAAIVGRLGGFTWYALRSEDPTSCAPRVARRLADRGRICGVFGLDPVLGRLVVSVAFDGTPALVVDLRNPSRLATSCLGRIGALEAGGSIGIAARTAEALSGVGIGRKFFATFRATLDRFTAGMPDAIPGRHRHQVALLQLTRVLFLYFIQAKGWLDGSEHFLRKMVDDCLFSRRPIHRSLLIPLFFGTLNQPASGRRGRARTFGRIPFLNGGLFEPHRLERTYRPDLPDSLWRDAFDTLFERYHFTVREEGAGSIAPDMLGMVFEGVMEPEERRRSGTFYTPASQVRSIVEAALAGFVAGRLRVSDAEALRRLEGGDAEAVRMLEDITILDPAAGSGAFLLGALERIVAFHEAAGAPVNPRQVVARNLFGVDLNPAAIQLAELRLWLAVVGVEPDGAPEDVTPLPNLDAFVRQGDTLSDPLRRGLQHPLRSPLRSAALAGARRTAAVATGRGKKEALRRLRHLELETAGERLDAAIAEWEGQLRAILATAREATLFGERRGLDRRSGRMLARARREIRTLRRARRQVREDGILPSFDFDTQFGDVTSRGGFDLVVGNPPWVRAEALPSAERATLRERFRWWRAGNGRGYGHQPDLAVAFLERGWELTRPGGVLAMLVPAKVATAGYAAAARTALAEQGTLLALADLTDSPGTSFEATAYPMAVVVRADPEGPRHGPMLGLHPDDRRPVEGPINAGAPWILHRGDLHRVAARLRRHPTLAQTVRIQLGVKTGANHLFLSPPPGVEPDLVRPALRGKDIHAFDAAPSTRIIWTHDAAGAPLSRLPPGAAAHFTPHIATLRDRTDDTGSVPWRLFRVSAGAEVPRVVWADLAPRLEAASLLGGPERKWVPLNSSYVVCCPEEPLALALCAWLNATWVRALARITADPASGGFARFNARSVGAVPLPADLLDDPELAALGARGRRGEEFQGEVDELVGARLELGTGERRVLSEVVGVGTARRR